MGNQVDNKFTWVIKNYKSLQMTELYSDPFSIGGCKWQIIAYPQGYHETGYLSLYLKVYINRPLPRGWKRRAMFSFTVVNQILSKLEKTETQLLFTLIGEKWGFSKVLPHSKLLEANSGFLINGELKIIVQIDVLQDNSESSQPLKKVHQELSSDLLNKSEQLQEGFEVYRFLLFPSQDFLAGVLLGLIETLCQSLEEITDDDVKEASAALSCLVNAGFKVDWLEKKMNQVSGKKKIVKSGEARLMEIKEELDKKTAEIAAAKTPLSFDDFL